MLLESAVEILQPYIPLERKEIFDLLESPPNPGMGDLAFPCFVLAKKLRRSPQEIAQQIAENLSEGMNKIPIGSEKGDTETAGSTTLRLLQRAEARGGYLNLFFERAGVFSLMLKRSVGETGLQAEGEGKKVVIEFSSPNIAKPFGVGHLRSTVIGHSLSRIYESLGYKVIRINHLGDWGTQFGKEIAAYLRWGDPEKVKANPIPELLNLYVKFHEEAETNPELEEEGRRWFKKLEEGDIQARELWGWFVEESLAQFQKMYELLGVKFDHFIGESFYSDKMGSVIETLKKKGLLVESEGAQVVDLSDKALPPCLIIKSDGSTLYATRDLAAAIYRQETFHFDKMLYVVGAEQSLHFQQIFAVLEKMGFAWAQLCEHVPFGLMQIEGKKMSTRKGRVVFLEEVLSEAVARVETIIAEKNPDLPNPKETAQEIGVGAVIFHDLKTNRIHNVNFSWEEVLNFDGETGPYVQYTYARTESLLRKGALDASLDAAEDLVALSGKAGRLAGKGPESLNATDVTWLTQERGWEVVKLLTQYSSAVVSAAEKNEPSQVARYLLDLCQAFNRFYHEERILVEDTAEREGKLLLTRSVGMVLKHGLYLLGLQAPEQI